MVKRATRQDVAQAAGVSGATVSRVYNTPDLVDRTTADRVRAAAAQLGFVPDKHAAALRRGSSTTLLFVEIDFAGTAATYRWPSQRAYQSLYGEIVRAVLHSVQGTPFTLQLVTLASAAEIPTLADRGDFAGILGFDVTDQEVAGALAALGRPVVCAHHGDHLTGVSTVSTDNRAGGRIQAGLLAAEAPGRVAYVTGLRDEVRSHRLRWEGFCREGAPAALVDTAVGFAGGRQAARTLAPQVRSGTIGAIGCVNDLTALGVVQGLADEGLGAGVVVAGYDNLVLTGLLGPGLPTVDARLPEVYTRALEVLVARVASDDGEVHETVEPVAVRAS